MNGELIREFGPSSRFTGPHSNHSNLALPSRPATAIEQGRIPRPRRSEIRSRLTGRIGRGLDHQQADEDRREFRPFPRIIEVLADHRDPHLGRGAPLRSRVRASTQAADGLGSSIPKEVPPQTSPVSVFSAQALALSCKTLHKSRCLDPMIALATFMEHYTQKDKTKCWECLRKFGLTGFACRCGYTFCARHRYAEDHDCTFDHRSLGRQILAKQLLPGSRQSCSFS